LLACGDFFDPHDAAQVKYEMLRRVRVDDQPVTAATRAFGFSRPTFYQAHEAFERAGLPGLLPGSANGSTSACIRAASSGLSRGAKKGAAECGGRAAGERTQN
jgi:hypothetical protein